MTNNFGPVIRIGDGDEVRDVPHPLSVQGLTDYDYALTDSAAIHTTNGEVTVYEIRVRPRSFARPLVVGTLYLDVASAELVRFRFSFTSSAYLDRQLEDISVLLENALYQNRYWLPDGRKSKSGGGPPGSTFLPAASSEAAGKSRILN